jgi:hypothetical protein
MTEEANELANRIYREAADMRKNGESDEEILKYLMDAGLDRASAEGVIGGLAQFIKLQE